VLSCVVVNGDVFAGVGDEEVEEGIFVFVFFFSFVVFVSLWCWEWGGFELFPCFGR